ncbi:MAG: hypothetical protein PHF02_04705 [Tepidiphilus sp.]|uniref:Uncharacterized protein n=1 Tax=Tepidiphilus baoligensis TaxID=2698687 RepID=A0ABX1QIR6_9PROT|nr:hypothetical protein [Tepidiphilus baoligensis]MDD2408113.1 hypothetical protein [Tepidiphilus sp.]MDD3433228.1 hypothetical protein [Tepidiphilus sp.]NMH15908.1 hypothetical protein [Tepidiphilus baoligensis]
MECLSSVSSSSRFRHRQRLIGAEAFGPFLDGPMLEHPPRIDVCERLHREAIIFFLLGDPSRKRLFQDPTSRALHAPGEIIDFFGQGNGNMSRQNAGIGFQHSQTLEFD